MSSDTSTSQVGSDIFSGDDFVLPFQTVRSGMLGRIARLGGLVDGILSRHEYPDNVSEALGQAIALTAMLGTALKFDGNLILQTKTDGPLGFLVANFETPGNLRGYAGVDQERCKELMHGGSKTQSDLLGSGHLAITIDPNGDMDRYQGIVALDNQPLVDAAYGYFKQSEQLPTFIKLAVARHFIAGANGEKGAWHWRAGGLLVQHVSPEGGIQPDLPSNLEGETSELPMIGEDDDDWTRVRYLAETVEDHELLDPNLTPDRLLYRLFHEEGVRVGQTRALNRFCRCNRSRIKDMLKGFGREELGDMRNETGKLSVRCEFCTSEYLFDDAEIA